jgi:TRAP-type C4-dicarboxylate transport system permease small subunit
LKFDIYFIACLLFCLFLLLFFFASPQQVDQFYSTQMYAMDLSQQYFMMPQAYMQQQESLGVMEKVFLLNYFF